MKLKLSEHQIQAQIEKGLRGRGFYVGFMEPQVLADLMPNTSPETVSNPKTVKCPGCGEEFDPKEHYVKPS